MGSGGGNPATSMGIFITATATKAIATLGEVQKKIKGLKKSGDELGKIKGLEQNAKTIENLTKRMNKLYPALAKRDIFPTGKFSRTFTTVKKLENGMRELTKETKRYAVASIKMGKGRTLTELLLGVSKSSKLVGNFAQKLDIATRKFQGWALSVMFFGMAIKRVFESAIKKSIGIFNEIMASTTDSVSNIAHVGAMFQYLGFVVGEALNTALEPFIPVIMEIISALTEWIEKHPKLTAWILILGFLVGGLLMLLGILVLGVGGLIQAFFKIGPVAKLFGQGLVWVAGKAYYLLTAIEALATKIATGIFTGTAAGGAKGTAAAVLANPFIAAVLVMIAGIIYLGYKWDWEWAAMYANATIWGLNLLRFFNQLVQGWVDLFSLGAGSIKDTFAAVFNDIITGWNKMINKISQYEGMSWITRLTMTPFETTGYSSAMENFNNNQNAIDTKFDEKIKGWEDVLAEWTELQQNEAELELAKDQEAIAQLAESEGGDFPETGGNTYNYIDQVNVNGDNAQQILDDMNAQLA